MAAAAPHVDGVALAPFLNMAAEKHETAEERQNRGYDEAVDGNPPVKLDIMDTVAEPKSPDERRIDRAAGDAANDVRRREHSAE